MIIKERLVHVPLETLILRYTRTTASQHTCGQVLGFKCKKKTVSLSLTSSFTVEFVLL